MAQGCEKKARAFVVFSVLEANDNVFLTVIGQIKEDKGEGCLPMQGLLFQVLMGER